MDSNALERRASFDAVFPTREQFLESCMAQEFSFPKPIMKYIWSNPSTPEVYEKLIKSCKLFFIKNPILVFKNLSYNNEDGWEYCYVDECDGYGGHGHKNFEMDECEGKIWVKNNFYVCSDGVKSTVAADIIPKIYRNDIKVLGLHGQIVSYDELKFFAAGVEECSYSCNIVKYDNGKEVLLDEVIKLFSGAKNFSLFLGPVLFSTVCKSYDDFLNACNKVRKFKLAFVRGDFDESKSHVLFHITSCSDDANGIINEIIEEILVAESFDFVPPVITYAGQDKTKLQKMKEIQEREAAKYR